MDSEYASRVRYFVACALCGKCVNVDPDIGICESCIVDLRKESCRVAIKSRCASPVDQYILLRTLEIGGPEMLEEMIPESASEHLVKVLVALDAPKEMIQRAADGYYELGRSTLREPIRALIQHAELVGLDEVAWLARQGEFNARHTTGELTMSAFDQLLKKS